VSLVFHCDDPLGFSLGLLALMPSAKEEGCQLLTALRPLLNPPLPSSFHPSMSTSSLNPFSFSPRRMELDLDAIEEEDSPYPEVRASVSNIDDQDMPTMTIRMWFIGLFLCTAGG